MTKDRQSGRKEGVKQGYANTNERSKLDGNT